MKKLILIGVIFSSMTSFAKDTVNYDYCNASTEKLFQLADIPGKKLPNIFSIKEDGMLEVNEDHVKLVTYNDEGNKQTYKFKTSTEKKSLLRLFSQNNAASNGAEYKFEVIRDEKGRISSIEKIIDSDTCEKCVKNSKKVSFTYSKKSCVPEKVYSNDPIGGTAIVSDVVACKSIIEQQKDFYKSIRNGSKCLNNLVEMYNKAQKLSGEMAEQLNKEGNEQFEDYIQSIFVGNLKDIATTAESLSKPLSDYAKLGENQFEFQNRLASVISNCTDNFDEKMLNKNKVFNKDFSIKKEDRVGPMPVDKPAGAIEAN